jgi:hypothetical protein
MRLASTSYSAILKASVETLAPHEHKTTEHNNYEAKNKIPRAKRFIDPPIVYNIDSQD